MNKAKLVGMICKELLQTLEENPPIFWNKESPHTLFNKSSILRKKLDYNLHNKNPKICTTKTLTN